MWKINRKDNFQFLIFMILALFLIYTRFVNIGWGLPYPMHPDERNMANAIQFLNCEIPNLKSQIPNKFQISNFKFQDCLNPHFFAYGQFPLYVGYLLVFLGRLGLFEKLAEPIGFQKTVLTLRIISAVSSVITVFILLKILGLLGVLGRLGKKSFMFHVLCFMIIIFSPVLIQFAHFGTTESLLILLYSLIIYCSILFIQKKLLTPHYLLLTSVFSGLAVATKVSSLMFLALPIFTVITCDVRSYNRLSMMARYIILTAITAIIFSPHNLISFREFISSIQYESAVALGNIRVFYTRQFDHTVPILFQITKIFPHALSWPVYILGLLGMLGILGGSWRKKEYNLLRIAFLVVFLPNAFMFAKWTRFMAPAFPILLIFAMIFVMEIKVIKIIKIIIIIVAVLPGIAYLSIYQRPDVRFQASEWIYKNIPDGSRILSETANVIDLPLPTKPYTLHPKPYTLHPKPYNLISFNFYDLDENINLQRELSYYLKNADYIIVPSRRIWANHTCEDENQKSKFKSQNYKLKVKNKRCETIKKQYPLLNVYYKRLFSGELGFKKVAEFDSYPRLGSLISFPDEEAEETWTVFDHPVVRIFKRI